MKFLKFTDPYYALILGNTAGDAIKGYEEVVSDIDESLNFSLLDEESFVQELSKTVSEETGKPIGIAEAKAEVDDCKAKLETGEDNAESYVLSISSDLVS